MIAAATGPRRPEAAGNEPEQGHALADDDRHSRTLFTSAPGG